MLAPEGARRSESSYYFFGDSGPLPSRAFFGDSGPLRNRSFSFEASSAVPRLPSKGLFSTNVCTFARTLSLSLRPLTCTRDRF